MGRSSPISCDTVVIDIELAPQLYSFDSNVLGVMGGGGKYAITCEPGRFDTIMCIRTQSVQSPCFVNILLVFIVNC